MAGMQLSTRKNYQCTLADFIPTRRQVIVDEEDGSRRLLENGISYNDHMRTVDGQYTELLTITT